MTGKVCGNVRTSDHCSILSEPNRCLCESQPHLVAVPCLKEDFVVEVVFEVDVLVIAAPKSHVEGFCCFLDHELRRRLQLN